MVASVLRVELQKGAETSNTDTNLVPIFSTVFLY